MAENTQRTVSCALEGHLFRGKEDLSEPAENGEGDESRPELKQAFTAHREETQGHIERLEQVFEMIGKRPQAKACEAINGIIAEGEETIEDFGDSAALDTGLVAAGQAVEHYEMARYGALAGWATQLGMPDAAELLNQTLQEEMNAEKLLTQIAKSKADKTAATRIAA